MVPHPHVLLIPQEEFFTLGSEGLWDSLSIEETVEAGCNVPDALAAGPELWLLCTLVQS